MGLELIRWKANERVGLPDQEAMTDLILDEMNRFQGEAILQDSTGPRVLGGFGLTDLGGGLARLYAGRAILSILKDQALSHGYYLGVQSPSSYQIDFSGAADDTYDVYIRAVYSDGTFENRVFWNPGSSAEYIDYTATRRLVLWETTFVSESSPSPGAEWLRVWSVDVASTVITGTTDHRQLFFEGPADDTYSAEWGDGANDRNSDRSLYGATDWWTWAQLVRRQIADVIGDAVGAHTHWAEVPIELTQLAQEHYAEAAGASKRGKHKDITFGGASNHFWRLVTNAIGDYETVTLSAIEETLDTPWVQIDLGDQGLGGGERMGMIRVQPYGSSYDAPQAVDEYCGIEWWGANGMLEVVTATAANGMVREWQFAGTSYMALLESGADQGLVLNIGDINCNDRIYAQEGFWLQATHEVYITVPWSSLVSDVSATRWGLFGSSSGNVAGSTTFIGCAGATGSQPVFLEFRDFPDGATLLSIDVTWGQGTVGATNEMRMYVSRYENNLPRPADTHNAALDHTAGTEWVRRELNSTQNWVEYAKDVTNDQTRRFKPDQYNTNWDRRKHKLMIGISAPDDNPTNCVVYEIVTRWQYQEAGPWGRTAGW